MRQKHFVHMSVAALGAATLSFTGVAADADGPDEARTFTVEAMNLHRVRVLLEGDARALWVGDSWSLSHNTNRLPFGSLLVWPIGRLQAIGAGFRTTGPVPGTDFTSGPGSLTPVDSAHQWVAEVNDDTGPARIALPLNDMTKVLGETGLELDGAWAGPPRIQDIGVRNLRIDEGDLPPFSEPGDEVRVRPLYYCPRDLDDLIPAVALLDQDATLLEQAPLRIGARGFWHLGDDPSGGGPRVPVSSQVNAYFRDLPLGANLAAGPRLVVCHDPAAPLPDSLDYWFFAGAVFYRVNALGQRTPGFYHSVLSTVSWQLNDYATDGQSNGNKRFTDAQLTHWLDVTTLDRGQTPVVILHIASERLDEATAASRTRAIVQRFRDGFARIGTAEPRFLLIGSYMHRTGSELDAADRGYVEAFNKAMLGIATTEPDCAFASLYAMTDGVYFTTDEVGGAGTQQRARDWLNSEGWSTISYGGKTYNLSGSDGGGLDGVLVTDGLHVGSSPAAAFFAKLLGDAIASAACPGDFDGDGTTDTRDVLAFLNDWAAGGAGADFNGDGVVDSRDVVAFLNAWNEPC